MLYVVSARSYEGCSIDDLLNLRKPDGGSLTSDDMVIFLGSRFTPGAGLTEITAKVPYTIVRIDSVYDKSWDRIGSDPEYDARFGGEVKRLSRKVVVLRNCTMYTIDSKKIFVFTGGVNIESDDYIRGLRTLIGNKYVFDYAVSNSSMMRTAVALKRNDPKLDKLDMQDLDMFLIISEFDRYIFSDLPMPPSERVKCVTGELYAI